MKSNQKDIFTLMVDNEFGVLTRITALIRRAGWNIRSLAVAETAVPEISRLTICLECRHNTLDNVLDRLSKLNCVREISVYDKNTQAAQELCLLRMENSNSPDLVSLCNVWNARRLMEGDGEAVLSVCCDADETDTMLEQFMTLGGLRDIARTGTVALRLGNAKGGVL